MESQRQAVEIGLQVDFGGKPAARAAEGLAVLPPYMRRCMSRTLHLRFGLAARRLS
jgi:hypothetical protein